jgi:hypothetical protein
MYTCPWCSKEIQGSGRAFGGHKTNCRSNPKYLDISNKRNKTVTKDREITYNNCEICQVLFCFKRIVGSKETKRFCSRACANSRSHSKETIEKITTGIHKFVEVTFPKIYKLCPVCGNSYYKNRKTCSAICGRKLSGPNISKSLKGLGKTGGWRNFGGSGLKGTYEGITYQSSWELAWIVYHLDHNISFRRCTEYFDYEFEGKQRKYYPDFYLDKEETYVEVKAYHSDLTKAKINSVPAKILLICGKNAMEPFLLYAINKGIKLTK